jgi:hypothetical protein
MMKRSPAILTVLLVLGCGCFLLGRFGAPTPTATAAPAPEEGYQYRFLEVGKTYTFHWRDTTQGGTLAEVPRAGWVKIKAPATGVDVPAVWVNLTTVEWISEDGKAK